MYTEWYTDNNTEAWNHAFYKNAFNENFDLKFKKPKKYQCDKYNSFKNTHEHARTKQTWDEHADHKKEIALARKHKEDLEVGAKNSKTYLTAAFDLEKFLLESHGQTYSFYQSRRLKNHSLTVTDISSMKIYCFLWDKGYTEKDKWGGILCMLISGKNKRESLLLYCKKLFSLFQTIFVVLVALHDQTYC